MAYKSIISLMCISIMFASNVRYGGELYQDGKNARNAALGGLSVSYADGCNPVLLKNKKLPSIHFSHKNKFGGQAQVTILSYLYPGKKYPLYLGLINRSVDNIPNTSSACDHSTLECNYSEIDYFSQKEIGIKLSTIRSLGTYTLGYTLKPSFTSLAEFGKGYGLSGDVAAMLQPLNNLDVTLRMEDILWHKYWETGTKETISPLFIGGIHYRFSKLAIGVETGSRIERNTFLHYHVGIEYEEQDQLFFRVGTSHLNQFTAGLGIRHKLFEFSYAYLHPDKNKPFEASYIISAGINLDEIHRIKGKITP